MSRKFTSPGTVIGTLDEPPIVGVVLRGRSDKVLKNSCTWGYFAQEVWREHQLLDWWHQSNIGFDNQIPLGMQGTYATLEFE